MATTLIAAAAKSAVSPRSTCERAVKMLPHMRTNLSSTERWASLGVGALLAGYSLSSRKTSLLGLLSSGALIYRAVTGNCAVYQALGVSTSDSTAPNSVVAAGHGTRVECATVVMKPAAEVYRFWRDFENLPRFMTHLLDVDTTVGGKSHWVARGPLGLRMEWDAEIVADRPGEVIAWKSLDGADVDTAGSVHFTQLPHDRGTEVRVELKYDPPAGKLGTWIAKLCGEEPHQQIREDLRRFKQILETGEIASTDGQPHGKR